MVELEVRREGEQHMRWRRHTSRVSEIQYSRFLLEQKYIKFRKQIFYNFKYFKGLYTVCLGTYTCKNKHFLTWNRN